MKTRNTKRRKRFKTITSFVSKQISKIKTQNQKRGKKNKIETHKSATYILLKPIKFGINQCLKFHFHLYLFALIPLRRRCISWVVVILPRVHWLMDLRVGECGSGDTEILAENFGRFIGESVRYGPRNPGVDTRHVVRSDCNYKTWQRVNNKILGKINKFISWVVQLMGL